MQKRTFVWALSGVLFISVSAPSAHAGLFDWLWGNKTKSCEVPLLTPSSFAPSTKLAAEPLSGSMKLGLYPSDIMFAVLIPKFTPYETFDRVLRGIIPVIAKDRGLSTKEMIWTTMSTGWKFFSEPSMRRADLFEGVNRRTLSGNCRLEAMRVHEGILLSIDSVYTSFDALAQVEQVLTGNRLIYPSVPRTITIATKEIAADSKDWENFLNALAWNPSLYDIGGKPLWMESRSTETELASVGTVKNSLGHEIVLSLEAHKEFIPGPRKTDEEIAQEKREIAELDKGPLPRPIVSLPPSPIHYSYGDVVFKDGDQDSVTTIEVRARNTFAPQFEVDEVAVRVIRALKERMRALAAGQARP